MLKSLWELLNLSKSPETLEIFVKSFKLSYKFSKPLENFQINIIIYKLYNLCEIFFNPMKPFAGYPVAWNFSKCFIISYVVDVCKNAQNYQYEQ